MIYENAKFTVKKRTKSHVNTIITLDLDDFYVESFEKVLGIMLKKYFCARAYATGNFLGYF